MNPTIDRGQSDCAATVPSVSVVIPTYNRAGYVGEAVESVLRQTCQDFEIIVVDDGSTDGTSDLLRTRFRDRVRCIRQVNRGISAALNAGVRAATGRYIARLDSDDLWHPAMLATLVSVLDEHPGIGVAYARAEVTHAYDSTPVQTRGLRERYPGDVCRSLLYEDCTASVAMLVRRTCLDLAGIYDESLFASEDWDMSLRLARVCRFQFVEKVVARIRLHSDSLTGTTSQHLVTVLDGRTVPLDKFFSDPALPESLRSMKGTAYSNVYTSCGLRWLQVREVRRSMRAFSLAARASNNPLATVVRIVWFAVFVPVLARNRHAARLVRAFAEHRSRRREG